MPVRTRMSAPTGRIYKSSPAQEQVKFRPRKNIITYRRRVSSGNSLTQQQTLTQIDFVSTQETICINGDQNEYGDNEKENVKHTNKRRRTGDYEPPSATKFHTQTLTQLEFVSTPTAWPEESICDDEDVKQGPADQSPGIFQDRTDTIDHPKTPIRRRAYEIPSSQSPITPSTNHSHRSKRSPLKAVDSNIQVWSSQGRSSKRMLIKPEVGDSFEYVEESREAALEKGPETKSVRQCISKSLGKAESPQRKFQRWVKNEIQDSDEDEDDFEINQWSVDPGPETLVETNLIKSSITDTQEAEDQLQSNILQFTQPGPLFPKHDASTGAHDLRPLSQATTASLTQTSSQRVLASSPSIPLLATPQLHRLFRNEEEENEAGKDDNDGNEQERDLISDSEREATTIPDSPSRSSGPLIPRPRSCPLSSPVLPRLRGLDAPRWEEDADPSLAPIPLSMASSQFLTRSQMLPESLMDDSIPPPPTTLFFVEDSDLEE